MKKKVYTLVVITVTAPMVVRSWSLRQDHKKSYQYILDAASKEIAKHLNINVPPADIKTISLSDSDNVWEKMIEANQIYFLFEHSVPSFLDHTYSKLSFAARVIESAEINTDVLINLDCPKEDGCYGGDHRMTLKKIASWINNWAVLAYYDYDGDFTKAEYINKCEFDDYEDYEQVLTALDFVRGLHRG